MNVAYVRVSTAEQNEARQKEALEKYEIEKWFIEKVSAKDTNREEFQKMMPKMFSGEDLVKAMSVLPKYDPAIAFADNTKRLLTLSDLYKVIPCVTVQCPFDSSVKGLLLEILRKVDESIGTRYYESALRARSTTDMLIGSVSQVCLNHVGMLMVDDLWEASHN